MTKKICTTVILLTVGFFCFSSNMLYAKDYTSVEDIKLDGKDAVGKKATLCVGKAGVNTDSNGTYFYAYAISGKIGELIDIYFEKNQKQLVKNIENIYEEYCSNITIKIIDVGYTPKGELISVE